MDIENINIKSSIGVIGGIITSSESRRGILIPTLHKMQLENGYLPEDLLRLLSKKLSIPLAEIYSVASFYKQFHFTPRGKNIVRVCTGTACHVRGSAKVVDALQNRFNVKAGETTEDLKLTLETVGCVGCCGLAPVVTVNEGVVGAVGPKKLKGLIHDIEEGDDNGKS
ncbi:MAG: NAD(P)H-dependent oxidoreductase subunit E [Nitrospirae bacterium]|nr:NAD(P)H-dependent oxidoreductase subunit E [Nitrospirota bacterium]MBF0536000.1 NAD(P)H-dependent oxidoreductase subunit E [Nitrospirota bacterium]MBF0617879.1 NAD(P)H-dependent oxidoreductase subunit E [Nitrospirota bacterium]